MNWTTIVAIYLLFWVMSAFLVLPLEARSGQDRESVAHVPGQERGAPVSFQPWRIVARTTIVATILFSLFYANYIWGWVTPAMLDVFGR